MTEIQSPPKTKKRILVVDDELDFTHMLKLTLELTGEFYVRGVNFASQMLGVAREFRPDLVLLDCMMPVMDGGELAAQLEADPVLNTTPFAFVTATVDVEQAMPSSCYHGPQIFLPKPVQLARLVDVIREKTSHSRGPGSVPA